MAKKWLTADFHVQHQNILKYQPNRVYNSIEEHDKDLLERYNSRVKDKDTVYILGDMSLSFDPLIEFVPRLRGHKHLLAGNHDRCFKLKKEQCNKKYLALGFESLNMYLEIELAGMKVALSHLPFAPEEPGHDVRYLGYRPKFKGLPLLHGHGHSSPETRVRKFQIDVGVDAWDLYPVSEEELEPILRSFYG